MIEGCEIDESVVTEFLDQSLEMCRGQGMKLAFPSSSTRISYPISPFHLKMDADLISERL
jgi:hypothetical protein